MAKTARDPLKPETYRDMWVCEGCSGMHEGVSPPAQCYCGHTYFENTCDLLNEENEEGVN